MFQKYPSSGTLTKYSQINLSLWEQICYGYPGLKYPDVFLKYPSSGALTIIQDDSQVNQSLGTSKPKVKVVYA
jgi:hypothetical protein